MLQNNVKTMGIFLFTALMSLVVFIALKIFLVSHLSFPGLKGLQPALSAIYGNRDMVEKGMGVLLIVIYFMTGVLLKDLGSILKNYGSILGLIVFLFLVEIFGKGVLNGGLLVFVHAPFYFMLKLAGEETAPSWFLTIPASFMLMGLYVRIGFSYALRLGIRFAAKRIV